MVDCSIVSLKTPQIIIVNSFENGGAKFFEQCVAGDIDISSNLVSYGSALTMNGEAYTVGVEAEVGA